MPARRGAHEPDDPDVQHVEVAAIATSGNPARRAHHTELVAKADTALYDAQNRWRDRVVIADG